MKTFVSGATAALGVTLVAVQIFAQAAAPAAPTPNSPARERAEADQGQKSQSEDTGGDARPSAVDPAQSHKTGANAGEGASYNRSTEKGDSTLKESSGQSRTR
jgi:hypothetical protein